ncbi:uncharacterized protein LOC126443034 [Schistocerca serialis cubense]|uniref:uncharacterized protein LOC126443034 n=1 Tax=Schistocerca serialis cubense TaxID=2023355 RepID=UPI00214E3919|nr:uncharacterized protein LOC126443034 [Schistocerca serialis cubense]
MPQLHCVHVLRDNEFGVHIAWPEAAVSLCCDAPAPPFVRPPPRRVPGPYTVEFNTRRLVVCSATFQHCLKWVRGETLEALRVADQCEGAGTHPASPFYYYRDFGAGRHCYGPICSFRGPEPLFCALCAYSHHYNCAGRACPLGGPVEVADGVELWCHPGPGPGPGRGGRRGRAAAAEGAARGGTSLEAELEDALRRPLTVRCPALEEVTVSGVGLAPTELRLLCVVAQLRVLRVESACLRGLFFLRHCRDTLEELTVTDATWLPPESFRDLRQLRVLKLLRVSKFRAPRVAIAKYTRHLRGLRCVLQKPLEEAAAATLPAEEEEIGLE